MWGRERSRTPGTGRERDCSEEHSRTDRGTPYATQRRCPQGPTRKPHQQRRVLKSHRHLAESEVERVGLRPPVVQKHAEEGEVEPEVCHAKLRMNRIAQVIPLD
jgi:hypothetical protein